MKTNVNGCGCAKGVCCGAYHEVRTEGALHPDIKTFVAGRTGKREQAEGTGGLHIGMLDDGSSVLAPGEERTLEIGERVFPLGENGRGN